MSVEDSPDEYGDYPSSLSAEEVEEMIGGAFERLEEAVSGSTANVLSGKAVEQVKEELVEKVVRAPFRREVGLVLKLSSSQLMYMGENLGRTVVKKQIAILERVLSKKIVRSLLKKFGAARVGLSVAGFVADGPLPIGDALAVYFAGDTVMDVYEIGSLVYECKKVHSELGERQGGDISTFEIISPRRLIEKYKDFVGDFDMEELYGDLFKGSGGVKFNIFREGFGWEHWVLDGDSIAALALFNEAGDKVAGIDDVEIRKLEEAAAEEKVLKDVDIGLLTGLQMKPQDTSDLDWTDAA
jgi:hypothetical protein